MPNSISLNATSSLSASTDVDNAHTNVNVENHNVSCLDLSAIDAYLMSAEAIEQLASQGLQMPMYYPVLKHYLPHRYPFMLVDRITACSPDEWITAYKNLSMNEGFFQGHFPDQPIMPGVLIVEALAQISGILGFISAGIDAEQGYLFLFAGIDKVRFKHQVVPGDTLILRSTKLMQKRGIYKFECRAHVGDKLAVSAQITIAQQQPK